MTHEVHQHLHIMSLGTFSFVSIHLHTYKPGMHLAEIFWGYRGVLQQILCAQLDREYALSCCTDFVLRVRAAPVGTYLIWIESGPYLVIMIISTNLSGPYLVIMIISTNLSGPYLVIMIISTNLSGPYLVIMIISTNLSGPYLVIMIISTNLSGPYLVIMIISTNLSGPIW